MANKTIHLFNVVLNLSNNNDQEFNVNSSYFAEELRMYLYHRYILVNNLKVLSFDIQSSSSNHMTTAYKKNMNGMT